MNSKVAWMWLALQPGGYFLCKEANVILKVLYWSTNWNWIIISKTFFPDDIPKPFVTAIENTAKFNLKREEIKIAKFTVV